MDALSGRAVALRQSCFGSVLVAAVITCGGEEESVPTSDSEPLDARLVETCTRLVSCPAATAFASVSQCLLANSGPLRTIYADRVIASVNSLGGVRYASVACLSAARGDCAAIDVCSRGRTSTCQDAGSACEGNIVVTCSNGQRQETDCSLRNCPSDFACDHDEPPGSQCLALGTGKAACGFGTCDETTFTRHCEGNALVSCAGGVVQRQDCDYRPSVGLSACISDASGARCESLLPACGEDEPKHCDGSDVVSCFGHRTYRHSCARDPLPMTCSSGRCVPSPGLRCNPELHADSCRGTSLVYCDGAERTVDCTALGFTGCQPTASGAVCR